MAKYDLTKFRQDVRLTQKELANILHITQGFMSSIETGRNQFPRERRVLIEEAFPEYNLDDYLIEEEYSEKSVKDRRALGRLSDLLKRLHDIAYFEDEGEDEDNTSEKSIKERRKSLIHAEFFRRHQELFDEDDDDEDEDEDKKSDTSNPSVASLLNTITELNDKLYDARNKIYELQQENLTLKKLLSK